MSILSLNSVAIWLTTPNGAYPSLIEWGSNFDEVIEYKNLDLDIGRFEVFDKLRQDVSDSIDILEDIRLVKEENKIDIRITLKE
jgi:hypothetical protein